MEIWHPGWDSNKELAVWEEKRCQWSGEKNSKQFVRKRFTDLSFVFVEGGKFQDTVWSFVIRMHINWFLLNERWCVRYDSKIALRFVWDDFKASFLFQAFRWSIAWKQMLRDIFMWDADVHRYLSVGRSIPISCTLPEQRSATSSETRKVISG